MAKSQNRDLKPLVDGTSFLGGWRVWNLFWYHNFKNEIDAWETILTPYWWKERLCLFVLFELLRTIQSKLHHVGLERRITSSACLEARSQWYQSQLSCLWSKNWRPPWSGRSFGSLLKVKKNRNYSKSLKFRSFPNCFKGLKRALKVLKGAQNSKKFEKATFLLVLE